MKSYMLCVATLLLLRPALGLAFSDADPEDVEDLSGGYTRSRRGWSMMRLGRGLQMLRLGKRTAPPHAPPATPAQMRELLGALVEEEEEKEQYRRQPPMPRYGRQLDQEDVQDLFRLLADSRLSRARHHLHAARLQRSVRTRDSARAGLRSFSYPAGQASEKFSSGS